MLVPLFVFWGRRGSGKTAARRGGKQEGERKDGCKDKMWAFSSQATFFTTLSDISPQNLLEDMNKKVYLCSKLFG